jgi:hypothetical protein
MEDKLRKLKSFFTWPQKQKNHHHLSTDVRSAGTDFSRSVARPHISLKARMLGGQAETIMRLGGSTR